MKRFLRYMFVITAILMVVVGDVWAESLQYTWVERFNGTTTFDNDDLQKITNGEYTNNVKFSISGVSWYNTLGVKRLDYPDQKDGNVHSSKWEWSTQSNDNNPYNVKVTKVQAAVRGYCNDGCDWANARFNNNDWTSCGTKDLGEGGSKDVSIENTQGLDSYVTLYTQNYYSKSSWSNWVEDYATFTLHNIRYTYKVTQRMPLFQYKAVAVAEPNTGGDVYASWVEGSFFASEAVATSYDAQIYDVSTGMTKTAYFKAVAKEGYNFVGWKRNPSDAQYVSTSAIYTENLTSKSNDADAPTTITMYAVFMPKNQPLFTGNDISGVKVGESVITDFVFEHVGDKKPTANENDDFYYVIQHYPDASSKADSPNPNLVVSYNPNTNQIIGLNSGTAKITFIHKDNDDYYYAESEAYEIAVIKHQPEFKWHGQAANVNTIEYFNNLYADFFISSSSTNNASLKLTYSSSDEDVATLSTSSNAQKLNLTTYNKEASTTLTITQAENYYWYGKTETKVVTPIDPNNHVPFVMNTSSRRIALFYDKEDDNGEITCSDGGEIRLNQNSAIVWTANPLYYTIKFTGVPDKLSFDYKQTATSTAIGATGKAFIVYESSDGSTWNEIWTSNGMPGNTDYESKSNIQLNPGTRYLKFFFDATYSGYYKNITVTELNELHTVDVNDDKVEVDTIYFAQQYVDNPVVTKKFALKYANAGYKVRLVSTDPQFTLNHTNIDTIGGEKYGTIKDFQVTYTPNKEHNTQSTDAKIRIYDECGKKDSIILVATTIKSTPTLRWTDAWSAKRPVLLLNQEVLDAAQSNNGYTQIKYRSSNPNAIEIINDGTAFRAKTVGDSAIITAYQEADRVYNAPEEIAKTFKVTDKMMQYIVWEDDLTKLYVDSEPVVLTAQVWVMTDAESGIWEYSAEQTAKLEYYSPNNGVVSVSNGTLYVHGTGELMLDAYVQADAIYEEVHTQIPVRVRDHSVVCTDEDLIIPLVGMNLSDELQYDPYALYDNEKIVEIDRSMGIPGSLHFSYRGAKAWGQLSGKIRVFESVDGGNNWSQVLSDADAVTPTTTTQYSPMIPLSRNATHLKFERYDDVKMGYHMIGYITVFPTKYIEAEDVDFGNVYVGNLISRNITFSYSSVRSDMDISTSHTKLTTTPTSISKECGAWGNESITITLNADASIVGEFSEQVQIYDEVGGIIETINVTANIIKNSPTITWSSTIDTIRSSADWESKKTAISSAGDEVQYEILSGNNDYARLDSQGKMILLRGGMITARAFTPENDRSNEVEQTRQFVIIVDPLFENTALDSDWHNPNNWNIGREPFSSDSATVLSNVLAMISHPIEILGLTLQSGSCVHIQSVAGIAVGNKGIRGAEDNSIIVDNTPNGVGFLKVDPLAANKPTNKVKINYTTCAYDSGSQRNEIWQYMGAPGTDMQMSDASYTMIYHWNEQEGWLKLSNTELTPFYGYAFTQSKAQEATFEISANPIIPGEEELVEISLTNTSTGMRGSNVFVNSFLAPIDLRTFDDDDFEGNVEQTFYLFNSGSWNQWQQNGGSSNTMQYGVSPGQYYALSPYGSPLMDPTYDQTTIPPMQGVYVIARENGAKIKLDYAKHVYAADASNAAMRIPQHQDDFKRIRLYVYGANSGADRMYLIQHDQCTSGYDNGYDAINMPTEGQVSIYSNEAAGQMEISITDRIDSSYIGFRAGMDSEYVLRMTSVFGEQLYLYDLQENTVVPIVDGTEYAFTATPNSVNDRRFLVTDKTSKSDVSDTEDVDVYIYDKKAYVKQAPLNSVMTVYTIGGLSMASYSVGNTPCVVDLSILPVGVYVLKVANKAYKFVCE